MCIKSNPCGEPVNAAVVIVDPIYPGTPLRVGSSGSEVARMQTYLNAIRALKYPALNLLTVDGKYGNSTKVTVMQYQGYALLPIDGVIGLNTWNSIVTTYTILTGGNADTYPGIPLRSGMTGQDVRHMQRYLNALALIYTAINTQSIDGNYGNNMSNAVRLFQRQFSLTIDGTIGQMTWNKIVAVYNASKTSVKTKIITPYPGYNLSIGSFGDAVRCAQSYINIVNKGRWYVLTVDGNFGQLTKNATMAFQASYGIKPDGIIGTTTWSRLVSEFNKAL